MTADAQSQTAQTPSAQGASATSCVHHWLIDAPSGRESTGVCKRCGATRNFANSTENVMWEQSNTLRNSLRSGIRISKPSEILLSDEVSDEA